MTFLSTVPKLISYFATVSFTLATSPLDEHMHWLGSIFEKWLWEFVSLGKGEGGGAPDMAFRLHILLQQVLVVFCMYLWLSLPATSLASPCSTVSKQTLPSLHYCWLCASTPVHLTVMYMYATCICIHAHVLYMWFIHWLYTVHAWGRRARLPLASN